MPELPEVETIRLGLQKYLVGHRIEGIEVKDRKIDLEKKNIIGAKVIQVSRFGKGLVVELDNFYSIAVHVKLTGQFIYRDGKIKNFKASAVEVGQVPNKFTRVIFKLDKGAFLYFNDVRRFAWLRVLKALEVPKLAFFKELGPEPPLGLVSGKPALSFLGFEQIVKKSTSTIKSLLMDQKKIGGVGNIYANDALFLAAIDPRRKAASLTGKEIKKLYDSIIEVLKRGLKYGGATEINFVNVLGQAGGYQDHFLVYARQGKECKKCKDPIKKIKIAGRGTYYCDKCQV